MNNIQKLFINLQQIHCSRSMSLVDIRRIVLHKWIRTHKDEWRQVNKNTAKPMHNTHTVLPRNEHFKLEVYQQWDHNTPSGEHYPNLKCLGDHYLQGLTYGKIQAIPVRIRISLLILNICQEALLQLLLLGLHTQQNSRQANMIHMNCIVRNFTGQNFRRWLQKWNSWIKFLWMLAYCAEWEHNYA